MTDPYLDALLRDDPLITVPAGGVQEFLGLPIRDCAGFLQTADVYARPASGQVRPALLCLHGGGWQGGTPQEYRRLARYLAWRYDLVVASASYRLIDRARFPTQIQDAANAMRWLRASAARWSIDPQRIGVAGSSAGGYLATMVALTHDDPRLAGGDAMNTISARPQALISQWGPIDFIARWYGNGGRPGAEKGLLNTTFTEDPTLYHHASALSHMTAAAPPALFVYGRQDPVVHLQQAELGAAAWARHGIAHDSCLVERIGHGGTDEADVRIAYRRIGDFLAEHLQAVINPHSNPLPFLEKQA